MCQSKGRRAGLKQEVKVHPPGYSLPVPDGDPVTGVHQTPDFLQDFGHPVGMAQTRVAFDRPDAGSDSILLSGCEACRADD